MSDLPEIRNGASNDEISYSGDAISHFQRQVRVVDTLTSLCFLHTLPFYPLDVLLFFSFFCGASNRLSNKCLSPWLKINCTKFTCVDLYVKAVENFQMSVVSNFVIALLCCATLCD